MDLVSEPPEELEYYKKCGVDVLEVSCSENTGVDKLKEFMKGKFTLMTGISGVGKSSIINALMPEAEVDVGVSLF